MAKTFTVTCPIHMTLSVRTVLEEHGIVCSHRPSPDGEVVQFVYKTNEMPTSVLAAIGQSKVGVGVAEVAIEPAFFRVLFREEAREWGQRVTQTTVQVTRDEEDAVKGYDFLRMSLRAPGTLFVLDPFWLTLFSDRPKEAPERRVNRSSVY